MPEPALPPEVFVEQSTSTFAVSLGQACSDQLNRDSDRCCRLVGTELHSCLLATTLDVYDEEGVRRVLRQYGPTGFFPMSDDDPAVLLQPGETMEDKQITAHEGMLERYSHYFCEECHLLGPMVKDWVAERLAGIKNYFPVLHANH